MGKEEEIKKAQEKNRYGGVIEDNPDGTVNLHIDTLKFMKACLETEKQVYQSMKQMESMGLIDDDADEDFWKEYDERIAKMEKEIAEKEAI